MDKNASSLTLTHPVARPLQVAAEANQGFQTIKPARLLALCQKGSADHFGKTGDAIEDMDASTDTTANRRQRRLLPPPGPLVHPLRWPH